MEGLGLADILIILVLPWLIQIERRLTRIEEHLRRLNNEK